MSMYPIYHEIAEKYGVNEEEVQKEIQEAIMCAYHQPQENEVYEEQEKIPCAGDTPTNEEFINYCVLKLLLGTDSKFLAAVCEELNKESDMQDETAKEIVSKEETLTYDVNFSYTMERTSLDIDYIPLTKQYS